MEQRWVALWATPNGTPQEFFFYSTRECMMARLDFALKLMDMGTPRPNEYELEEATLGFPSLPKPIGEYQ